MADFLLTALAGDSTRDTLTRKPKNMDIRSEKGVAVGTTQREPEDENHCRKGDLQPFLRVIGSPCPLGVPWALIASGGEGICCEFQQNVGW